MGLTGREKPRISVSCWRKKRKEYPQKINDATQDDRENVCALICDSPQLLNPSCIQGRTLTFCTGRSSRVGVVSCWSCDACLPPGLNRMFYDHAVSSLSCTVLWAERNRIHVPT